MNKSRKATVIIGVLILLAYSILGTNNPEAKIQGMLLEIISGFSVIAIAVLMYTYLKPYGKNLT